MNVSWNQRISNIHKMTLTLNKLLRKSSSSSRLFVTYYNHTGCNQREMYDR